MSLPSSGLRKYVPISECDQLVCFEVIISSYQVIFLSARELLHLYFISLLEFQILIR